MLREPSAGMLTLSILLAVAPPAAPPASFVPDDLPPPSDDISASEHQVPWIRRWAPKRNTVQLGAYSGVFAVSAEHELYDPGVDMTPALARANGTFGGRVGVLPSRFFGLELEGGIAPSRTDDAQRATLWHVRSSLVGQIGLWSVVPFVATGAGALGIRSASLGRDADATIHFGGGLKVAANERVQLRLDLRDVVGSRRGVAEGVSHNAELLFGAAVVLGGRTRSKPEPEPAPRDRDADGWIDANDACPDVAGEAPRGCPPPDSDGDGLIDRVDACPNVIGPAPSGCPPLDVDHDGWLDEDDACPEQPGTEPDGCPLRDRDGDGWLDRDDGCPDRAETRNGFEDDDGCPDELPVELEEFRGVIEGIHFDVGRDVILARSRPVLDRAVDVLRRYPSLRIEISGHTDSTGSRRRNFALSSARAEAVRGYLVDHGVEATRVITRGAGPDEPMADNATPLGRQKNRRIEFKILEQ